MSTKKQGILIPVGVRTSSELVALCERAELRDVIATELSIEALYAEFDQLWSPFAWGIGPAAEYLQAQDPARRTLIRDTYFDLETGCRVRAPCKGDRGAWPDGRLIVSPATTSGV